MTKLIFYIIIGIYYSVAKAYYLLIEFSDSSNLSLVEDSFGDLIDIMYVLAGLFMLFRITVTFLNMLIDPDKVNDKQMGAGTVIKRVFISLLLIIICQPRNFCFGLLDNLEEAVLSDENSLIHNIFSYNATGVSSTNKGLSIMFDDVYAASNEFSCFYNAFALEVTQSTAKNANDITVTNTFINSVPKGSFYITFTKDNSWKNVSYKYGLNDSFWYIKFNTSGTTPSGKKYNNSQLNNITNFKFDTTEGKTAYIENNICPKGINVDIKNGKAQFTKNDISGKANFYAVNLKENATNEEVIQNKVNEVNTVKDKFGSLPGFNEHYTNRENIQDIYNDDPTMSEDDKEQAISESLEYMNLKQVYKDGTDATSIKFARSIFLVFADNIYSNPDVDATLNTVLDGPEANGKVFDLTNNTLFKDAVVDLDSLMAIIVGIVVIVYLLMLCIDVVVRQFKLLLLKIIAPIPIICYIDPKDKIFDEWKKMIISVYVDLFIKILIIKLGTNTIEMVFNSYSDYSGLKKLMILFGIFVFIKAIPSIISKIFGIDASASSFKEIGKTVKGGIGITAGSIAGAATGLVSGAAAGAAVQGGAGKKFFGAVGGALLGATRGGLRGVGSGYRGDVLGGARSITSSNVRVANANRSGSSVLGRFGTNVAHAFGMRDAYERAQAEYEGNDAFVKAATSTEDLALNIAKKQAGKQADSEGPVDQVFDELDKATRIYDDYHSGKYTGSLTAMQIERNKSKAEKAAREKVINDTYSGNISGYVDYETDVDREQLMNSIRATETLGSQVGSSMFKQEQDEHGNATGRTIWNKESRDKAESTSIKAKGEMDKYKPNHDAASQTS